MAVDGFEVSEATASRDLALCRRMLREFHELFGRDFCAHDEVVWSWDFAYYSFRVPKEMRWMLADDQKPDRKGLLGRFAFSTRAGKTPGE